MGWADRARVEREANGKEPHVHGAERHAAWCQAPLEPCACYPIPALRCDLCGKVFEPEAKETAFEFHLRVRAHAMVHPDGNPSFTQGKVTRTLKSEGTE